MACYETGGLKSILSSALFFFGDIWVRNGKYILIYRCHQAGCDFMNLEMMNLEMIRNENEKFCRLIGTNGKCYE